MKTREMTHEALVSKTLLEFAQLVQNANIGNCGHASKKIVRDANRLAIRSSDILNNPALICEKSEALATLISGIRCVESGSPEEIQIKRECMEILVQMKDISFGRDPARISIPNTKPLNRKSA